MPRSMSILLCALFLGTAVIAPAAATGESPLPRAIDSYHDPAGASLWEVLRSRAAEEPFNVAALAIFLCAIVHTFLTSKFRHMAHVAEEEHAARLKRREPPTDHDESGTPDEVSFKGQILHFFGEVEAVFGIWVLVLIAAITYRFGWDAVLAYVGDRVNYTEPMFVVVIMAIAATRPVLRFAQACLRVFASIGKGTTGAWWLSILVIAPVLGSFITEPAAMTIAALLLARQFYELGPSLRLAYATIGLLFVNISVGGTFTHFAAPPVLMVAPPDRWNWDTPFMFTHFGWKALLGILVATAVYYFAFRREFGTLEQKRLKLVVENKVQRVGPAIPPWITTVHLAFLAFTVFVAHFPPLFIGGFLFFLAFAQATAHHQGRMDLKPPLLVGFFLAGLVTHGGLQGWWIEPVLKSLSEVPLFVGATVLTAFNDNAAITYLATLVPSFTDELKYAVVAGAVTGGGLTVIANAPNPAGQTILQRFFPDGVSPLWLAVSALFPTLVMALAFMLFR